MIKTKCKKNLSSVFTKDKYYDADLPFVSKYPNTYYTRVFNNDLQFVYFSKLEFEDYFYSKKEIRKLKLETINEKG